MLGYRSSAAWSAAILMTCVFGGCGKESPGRPPSSLLRDDLLPPYAVSTGRELPRSGQQVLLPKGRVSPLVAHTSSSEGGDYDPAPSPDGSWFIFASTRNSHEPQLYRQDISGSVITQLTSPPLEHIQPAVSPDGSEVAFASRDASSWDIWIMPSRGGPRENLTSTPRQDELHPSWHPSGKLLVFNSFRHQDAQWWICAKARGSSSVSWITPGLAPSWSPKGDRIVFQRARHRGRREYGLWLVEVHVGEDGLVHGGVESQLFESSDFSAVEPAFSPDGERIVFVAIGQTGAGNPGKGDIWCIRSDGTDLARLTDTPEPEYSPAWAGRPGRSSENGRIFFTSERDGRVNIWSLMPEFAGREGTTQDGGAAK